MFNLINALSVYGEYAKQWKKPEKFTYLHSVLTKTKSCWNPCFYALDRLELSKNHDRGIKPVLASSELLNQSRPIELAQNV